MGKSSLRTASAGRPGAEGKSVRIADQPTLPTRDSNPLSASLPSLPAVPTAAPRPSSPGQQARPSPFAGNAGLPLPVRASSPVSPPAGAASATAPGQAVAGSSGRSQGHLPVSQPVYSRSAAEIDARGQKNVSKILERFLAAEKHPTVRNYLRTYPQLRGADLKVVLDFGIRNRQGVGGEADRPAGAPRKSLAPVRSQNGAPGSDSAGAGAGAAGGGSEGAGGRQTAGRHSSLQQRERPRSRVAASDEPYQVLELARDRFRDRARASSGGGGGPDRDADGGHDGGGGAGGSAGGALAASSAYGGTAAGGDRGAEGGRKSEDAEKMRNSIAASVESQSRRLNGDDAANGPGVTQTLVEMSFDRRFFQGGAEIPNDVDPELASAGAVLDHLASDKSEWAVSDYLLEAMRYSSSLRLPMATMRVLFNSAFLGTTEATLPGLSAEGSTVDGELVRGIVDRVDDGALQRVRFEEVKYPVVSAEPCPYSVREKSLSVLADRRMPPTPCNRFAVVLRRYRPEEEQAADDEAAGAAAAIQARQTATSVISINGTRRVSLWSRRAEVTSVKPVVSRKFGSVVDEAVASSNAAAAAAASSARTAETVQANMSAAASPTGEMPPPTSKQMVQMAHPRPLSGGNWGGRPGSPVREEGQRSGSGGDWDRGSGGGPWNGGGSGGGGGGGVWNPAAYGGGAGGAAGPRVSAGRFYGASGHGGAGQGAAPLDVSEFLKALTSAVARESSARSAPSSPAGGSSSAGEDFVDALRKAVGTEREQGRPSAGNGAQRVMVGRPAQPGGSSGTGSSGEESDVRRGPSVSSSSSSSSKMVAAGTVTAAAPASGGNDDRDGRSLRSSRSKSHLRARSAEGDRASDTVSRRSSSGASSRRPRSSSRKAVGRSAAPKPGLGPLVEERRTSIVDSDDDDDDDTATAAADVPPERKRDLFMKCRNGRHDAVEEMFALGIPVDTKDEHGNQCIHIAAQQGDKRLVKVCLRWGADIDAQNNQGQTALHYVQTYNFASLAEYLVSKGARKDIRNHFGYTYLEGLRPADAKEALRLLRATVGDDHAELESD